jgi:hypothetical protein
MVVEAETLDSAYSEGAMDQPWLTADDAGLAVGIAGGGLVVICACFGAFSRWLARQGQGRQVIATGFALLSALALAAIALGAYAYDRGQPTYLWCPMLGLGAAVVGILVLGLPGVILRYRRARQRRALQDLADQLVKGTSSRQLARAQPPRRWR